MNPSPVPRPITYTHCRQRGWFACDGDTGCLFNPTVSLITESNLTWVLSEIQESYLIAAWYNEVLNEHQHLHVDFKTEGSFFTLGNRICVLRLWNESSEELNIFARFPSWRLKFVLRDEIILAVPWSYVLTRRHVSLWGLCNTAFLAKVQSSISFQHFNVNCVKMSAFFWIEAPLCCLFCFLCQQNVLHLLPW